jgi:hypothetical protein
MVNFDGMIELKLFAKSHILARNPQHAAVPSELPCRLIN